MNKITLLFFFFLASLGSILAQNFEGIIKMHQQMASGIEYDVTWYIKKDKIAFEIGSSSARGMLMRFVPQREKNSILMVTGDTKKEIPTNEITTAYSFENIQVKEIKAHSNSNFKHVTNYEISTPQINVAVEVTKDIDVNFANYTDFFKNDYGIYMLASSNKKGFPINSTVTDKKGNIIVKTTFKSIEKTKVSESKFQ